MAEVPEMVPEQAWKLSRELLFLPVYPEAGEKKLARMAEVICRFVD